MWRLYAQSNEAVCIQSTFRKLREAIGSVAQVGMVRYVDYENGWIPESNPLAPFLYKRKSCEHEREARALIRPANVSAILEGKNDRTMEPGKWVKIDVGKTIDRVVIAPDAAEWFLELVQQVTARYERTSVPVVRSALAHAPFY